MRYSVAIVAIARNEGQYINEWIEYHASLGFDHFYIFDNSFGNEERLSHSISSKNKKLVSIIPAYNKLTFQEPAYGIAYNKFSSRHDYLLFIDIDEFFTLMQHENVSDYISFLNVKCPGFQNARIHWEIYDDNNAIERDMSIPVHEFFTQTGTTSECYEDNNSTKSIVKTKMAGIYMTAHFPQSRCGNDILTCDSTGKEIYPTNQFIYERDISIAKIRHYATKTISEYMYQKLCRGDVNGYIIRDIWNRFFNYCHQTSEKMAYYNAHKDDVFDGKYSGFRNGVSLKFRRGKIVVTMTSWTKRIKNCKMVVESVLNQSMKPNLVFLNLSLQEFPNRENDLPSDLVQLEKNNPSFKINWVAGNDKSFKKLFPILPLLDDNDIIMTIDDDYILDKTTIQCRYKDFIRCNGTYVIASDWFQCGLTMMFQKKMLNGYEMFLVPELVNGGNDDMVYYNLFYLNGYKSKPGSKIFLTKSDRFINDKYGLSANKQYLSDDKVTQIMEKILTPVFHNKWETLFGIFRRGKPINQGKGDGDDNSTLSETGLEKTFNECVERFFYGDKLQLIEDAKKVLFVGSDIPNQMNKDVLCCGLGWKYLPGQKHRDFRQFVPSTNFCYLRGEISKRQVIGDGVNLKKDTPIGDSRLLSSIVVENMDIHPTMDIGIVVGQNWTMSDDDFLAIAKQDGSGREVGIIRTPYACFDELVDFVLQSRVVISNSLWGIAVAHSFGVPAVCFLDSSGFEFLDYYSAFRRIRYRQLTKKLTFQSALESASDGKFVSSVNPTKDEVAKVQKNIVSALPYREYINSKT